MALSCRPIVDVPSMAANTSMKKVHSENGGKAKNSLSNAAELSLILCKPSPRCLIANLSLCPRNTEVRVLRATLLNGTKPTGCPKTYPSRQLFGDRITAVCHVQIPGIFRTKSIVIETSGHHELLSHVCVCHTACCNDGAELIVWLRMMPW